MNWQPAEFFRTAVGLSYAEPGLAAELTLALADLGRRPGWPCCGSPTAF